MNEQDIKDLVDEILQESLPWLGRDEPELIKQHYDLFKAVIIEFTLEYQKEIAKEISKVHITRGRKSQKHD